MKRYPAYKDSGVEWLGEVPEGWNILDLKQVCHVFPSNVDKHSHPDEIPVRLCNYTDVYYNDRITRSLDFMSATATEVEIEKFTLHIGDVIFTKDSETADDIGIAAVVSEELPGIICGYHLSIARPNPGIEGRFIKAFFDSASAKAHFEVTANGLTRVGLGQYAIKNLQLALPPLPEQRAIADFLDREVVKIDDLVAEQRRLIALLAEKRQAVISHAVTRGLNPNATLKPSGIDWLGDIPEGWVLCRLKDCVVPAEGIQMGPFGGMLKDLLGDPDEFKVYGQENVTNGDFERGRRWLDSRRFAELANYALRAGDLMLTRKGSIGNCFTFSAGAQPGIIDSDTIRIRLDEDVLVSEYTLTLLHDADYIAKQIDLTKRGAILASLNTSVVGNLAILRPPKGEQAEINKFIARERNAFDTLTETATSAITLLQERRAALISAAVTGKIDVRDAQAVPAQALQVSAMVAGVVIAGHWRQPNFGRVKLQKFLYLAQTHAGIPEIGGEFLREAAGPLDRQLQGQVEAELTAVGAIQVEQELGAGTAVRYQFQGDAAALRSGLGAAIGARMAAFQMLMDKLGDLDTRGIEAVATLYAAWNDLLIDGQTPTEADIIREVLENWHPEKQDKFSTSDLVTWLGWMRRQDITPTGTGQKTLRGRLFV